ncbi:MAG: bifunctional (p)ppGpp synthetase/guanosine-3',5'-bis(diphosphate) 3'-pyrophosphohydrolase [Proteobacteria bacterium]|nr:MAG: bifunctional (p)ppGpp synthetase/guanosine-3',5'-bis(diphosphate) 3'-pyrophosphohydrolase [Pseudomonadota bacterium]
MDTVWEEIAPAGSIPESRILISDLVSYLERYLAPGEIARVYDAYMLGAEAHDGQARSSGEPYIYHPIAVARILAEMRLDSRSLIAAILHDTLEDTEVTREELATRFGEDVAELVEGVTKIGQFEFDSREEAEAENFRKMLLAMSRDIRVILIKLADRLHNMRTMESLKPEKQRRISSQTLDIYAAIANRIGMHTWAQELEDLSFRYLYPKRYKAINEEVRKRSGNRRKTIAQVRDTLLRGLGDKHIEAEVFGREKNIFSIYRKMLTKHLHFSDLGDLYAIRVVVEDRDACYRALGVVHDLYKPVHGKFKDYIAIPKINGYQSLHTQVFGRFGQSMEVQIRSREMHRVAETGVASHWRYKTQESGRDAPQQLARRWLLELLEMQPKGVSPSEFLEHLKTDLFPDQVYVFTPKGDIKKLPSGATALDFAYAVHSDVGNHCVAAKVNHEMVPLHHVLANGNHVEVVTSKSAHPTPSWLNFCVSGKARSSIRTYLKSRREKDAVRLGRQLLNAALVKIGQKQRLPTDKKMWLLRKLELEDWNRLLEDIGTGRRLPMLVARQLFPEGEYETRDERLPLPIHGAEGLLVTYARCCRPIPGDRITGHFSAGRGLVIHTSDCPNIAEQEKHPDNWLDVNWADTVSGDFAVDLRFQTRDRPGVLARLAATIAEQGSNITNVSVESKDGRHSTINFTITVKNRKHLADILRKLRAHKRSIIRVVRRKG